MCLAYTISFLCFLRIEETLRLEVRHFKLLDRTKNILSLTMDFRKTHQEGSKLNPYTSVYLLDRC
jgi:hypothetical protein